MLRRVKRSGAALLASMSPSNSILKSVTFKPEYDMTVILSSTQHSLAALKVGINSQDRKLLTSTEKSILSINHTELTPNLSFQPETKPNRSGKSITFNEKIEIWFPDETKYLYIDLKDQTPHKNKTIPINLVQFMNLDLSINELYTGCAEVYGAVT